MTLVNTWKTLKAIKTGDLDYIACSISETVNWHLTPLFDGVYYALPIHYACYYGQIHIVLILIQRYPELLNAVDEFNQTPIHFAARKGHLPVVSYLAALGANLNMAIHAPSHERHDMRPIHLAVQNGHDAVFECLINHGAERSMRLGELQLHLIHLAVQKKQLKMVQILLDIDPDLLNITDMKGQTPVGWAVVTNQIVLVEYLTTKGAVLSLVAPDINVDKADFLPMHWAAEYGYVDILDYLIKHGPDIHSRTSRIQYHLIHIASICGHLPIVQSLLNQYPELLNIRDHYGQTPLLWAAANNHVDLVNYLVDMGANHMIGTHNSQSQNDGYLPLDWAVANGHTSVVECLIRHGVDRHRRVGESQYTLIHIAAMEGWIDVVKCLLTMDPEMLNITDSHGKTPLDKAMEKHRYDVSSWLILKITADQGKETIVPFVKSARIALDLMKLDPTLSSLFMQNAEIVRMFGQKTYCEITPKTIDYYKKSGRRPSFFLSVNREANTCTVLEPAYKLGQGSYGVVRLFQDATNQKMAVKSLKTPIVDIDEPHHKIQHQKLQREAELTLLAYPNDSVHKTIEFKDKKDGHWVYSNRFLMPLIDGEVAEVLIPKITSSLQLAKITLQMVQELHRIHQLGIIHGDLSRANMMICCDNLSITVRVIDFGCARYLTDKAARCVTPSKTKWYAPEVAGGVKPSRKQDIFSLAFTLNALFIQHPLFEELMRLFPSIDDFIVKGQVHDPLLRPSLPSFHEQLAKEIKLKTIEITPKTINERPTYCTVM